MWSSLCKDIAFAYVTLNSFFTYHCSYSHLLHMYMLCVFIEGRSAMNVNAASFMAAASEAYRELENSTKQDLFSRRKGSDAYIC